tara:strand:- start:55 stop:1413 length:1359 start_codon:yes stop_codon:yes gene_type:complete
MSRQLRDRKVSAQELTVRSLNAANQLNGTIKAFELIDEQSALVAAARLDEELRSGRDRGPMHGIPIAIKDIIDVLGWPTRCGSDTYSDKPATEDAVVVRTLRESGAVLIGKTVPHELACGVYSHPVRNPWNLSCLPGGSSGGSAACVAAGIVPMALGSDTGGSIRIPASVCGVAGIKPTFNRISCVGAKPLSWSLDHIGPIAASVEDCALSLQAMLGFDVSSARNSTCDFTALLNSGLEGLRMGVLRGEPFEPMHSGVEMAFDRAVDQLEIIGAQRVDVTIPELEHTIAVEFAIVGPEAAHYHRKRLREYPDQIDPGIKALLLSGLLLPSTQYLRGLQARKVIADAIRRCFDHHRLDIIVTPTLPATAATRDQEVFEYAHRTEPVTISYVRTTAPFNLAGLPALSVPCGFDNTGLPVGLQFVGRPMDEATVLRTGHAYELATTWHKETPTMS